MLYNSKFQTGKVLVISFTHFIHDVYSSFLAPILPLLIDKLSISYTQAGLLTVIQRLPSLLNPIIGILADKWSVKLFVTISPAMTVTIMSLLGIANNYVVLAILLFIMGIAASMFHVPAPVLIKEVAGDRIGKVMSYFMVGGELARSVGPIVILGGVSMWGLSGTYKLIPFGLAASLFLYFKFRNITPGKYKSSAETKSFIKILRSFRSLFINIIGILFFTSLLKGGVSTFLAVYLTDSGESLWYAGASLSIFQLSGAVGTLLSGTFSDKFGRRNILVISAVLNPILLIGFVYSFGVISILLLILLGFFLFAFTPVLLAIVNESKTEFPTFLNGIFMTINFITGAVTVSLIGVLADMLSLTTTYLLCSFLGLLTIIFVLRIKQ